MKTLKTFFSKVALLGSAFALALGLQYAVAWTAPTSNPPNNNVSVPVNVGSTAQVKNGGLSVNAFSAFGNTYVQGNLGVGVASPTAKLEVQGGAIKATGGFIVETRTSDPVSPVAGQMWLRTDL